MVYQFVLSSNWTFPTISHSENIQVYMADGWLLILSFYQTVSPDDYLGQVMDIQFNVGDARICYNISIIDDSICEGTSENFLSQLSLISGSAIQFQLGITEVIIEDDLEPECGQSAF